MSLIDLWCVCCSAGVRHLTRAEASVANLAAEHDLVGFLGNTDKQNTIQNKLLDLSSDKKAEARKLLCSEFSLCLDQALYTALFFILYGCGSRAVLALRWFTHLAKCLYAAHSYGLVTEKHTVRMWRRHRQPCLCLCAEACSADAHRHVRTFI